MVNFTQITISLNLRKKEKVNYQSYGQLIGVEIDLLVIRPHTMY